jgi:hypothetical protein
MKNRVWWQVYVMAGGFLLSLLVISMTHAAHAHLLQMTAVLVFYVTLIRWVNEHPVA